MRVPDQFIPSQERVYFAYITADYIGNISLHFLGLETKYATDVSFKKFVVRRCY